MSSHTIAQYNPNPSKTNTATVHIFIISLHIFLAMALFLLSSDNFVSLDGIPIKQVTQVQALCEVYSTIPVSYNSLF